MSAAPGNKYSYNNVIDTLSKKTLNKIKFLRFEKELSYKKIADEIGLNQTTIFKIIKKNWGLQTHQRFKSWLPK